MHRLACPVCNWMIDYGCGCPGGIPTFPLVEYKPLNRINELQNRVRVCWEMASVFLANRDAHGIHDMGVEIQALERALAELRAAR